MLRALVSRLFPYTTLFRSPMPEGRFAVKLVLDEREKDLTLAAGARGTGAIYTHHLAMIHIIRKVDRKSTRLNSSHLVISYAVFCLKKKSQINNGEEKVTEV